MTGRLKRLWAHLWVDDALVRVLTSPAALSEIENAIQQGEASHTGEICVAIEENFNVYRIWAETSPGHRASMLFSRLGVWDTEQNNGALIYLCLAERSLVLRVDRGIAQRCGQGDLDLIIENATRLVAKATIQADGASRRAVMDGLLLAIAETSRLLAKTHPGPRSSMRANQLSNRPILFR